MPDKYPALHTAASSRLTLSTPVRTSFSKEHDYVQKRRIRDRDHQSSSTLYCGLPHIGTLQDRTGLYVSLIDELREQIVERVCESVALYVEISAFAQTVTDPVVREIITLRYLDNLSWRDIAQQLGGGNTPDSVRMLLNRYLARNPGQLLD